MARSSRYLVICLKNDGYDVSLERRKIYVGVPDASVPGQRVVFGTSGHRGSPYRLNFNETHVLAITQAICEYRKQIGIDGPLFIGIDPHALSEPAFASALEVLAANGVEAMMAAGVGFSPRERASWRRMSLILCFGSG